MKIFITIPWFHPAYKAGGPIQSIANMVEALGNRQRAIGNGQWAMGNDKVEFNIFCNNKDLDGSLLQGVAVDEWVNYNEHTRVWYSSTGDILPVLQQEISKESPDFLFIVGIYDWQYNLKPLLFCKGVRKIISVRGMLHPGALSQKSFKKKIYLQLWKMLGLHKELGVRSKEMGGRKGGNVFHATDEEEKKYIQRVFGTGARVVLAGNFPASLPVQPVVQKEPGQLRLVSIALISPMKNILPVLEALGGGSESSVGSSDSSVGSRELTESNWQKTIGNENREILRGGDYAIIYDIYGPVKDKAYWETCEAVIQKLPANIRVIYHGDIPPQEIVYALAEAHVFILPSKSENFGHALYEALASGRPVITSNSTPWNGLAAAEAGINVPGEDILGLANAISHFAAMDSTALSQWSSSARKYALKAVDIERVRGEYHALFSA